MNKFNNGFVFIIIFVLLIISTVTSFSNYKNGASLLAGIFTLLTIVFFISIAFLKPMFMEESSIFIFGVIFSFLICIISIIILCLNKNEIENYENSGARGICSTKNGWGTYVDGVCVGDNGFSLDSHIEGDGVITGNCVNEDGTDFWTAFNETCEDAYKRVLKERELEAKKDGSMLQTGICYEKIPGEKQYYFGYLLPRYGSRCVPKERIQEDLSLKKQNRIPPARIVSGNKLEIRDQCYPKSVTYNFFIITL